MRRRKSERQEREEMKRLLCPSMMCANYGHLAAEVRALDDAGVDIFHCDIMDGSFVPNFTMGVMDVQTIRRYTDKPVDCHLMIENPGNKVDWFIKAGANIIYIHPESERYVVKTLAHIKEMGAAAGIAVNPDTSVASISEILNLCDYVMVMTVNPGFAGQGFIAGGDRGSVFRRRGRLRARHERAVPQGRDVRGEDPRPARGMMPAGGERRLIARKFASEGSEIEAAGAGTISDDIEIGLASVGF